MTLTNPDRSAMGVVAIDWHRSSLGGSVDVKVPAGAEANLQLPAPAVWTEGEKGAAHAAGVLNARQNGAGLRLVLGSGNYHFSTQHF